MMFEREKYRKTFSRIHASEETLTEVLKMTKQARTYSGGRVARAFLVAAVIGCALATTAFAYVGFTQYENPIAMLKSFFGSDEYHVDDGKVITVNDYGQQYDLVEPTREHALLDTELAEQAVAPYVSAVGQSISYLDYTLTVDAHLYNSATGCGVLNYRLENPNGISGYRVEEDGEIWWPDGELVDISAFGESYLMEERTDTALAVAFYYESVYGSEICITFYNRSAGDWEILPEESVKAESMTLPLVEGEGMETAQLADGAIVISPISMTVDVRNMDFLSLVTPKGKIMPPRTAQIEQLVIGFHDGTEFVVDYEDGDTTIANYTAAGANSTSEEIRYVFNRILDPGTVTSVRINEVTFEIDG